MPSLVPRPEPLAAFFAAVEKRALPFAAVEKSAREKRAFFHGREGENARFSTGTRLLLNGNEIIQCLPERGPVFRLQRGVGLAGRMSLPVGSEGTN